MITAHIKCIAAEISMQLRNLPCKLTNALEKLSVEIKKRIICYLR